MNSNELLDSDELRGRIWRGRSARSLEATLPTGYAALDRYLPGGGWPLGSLSEIFVERYGVGELTLLMPALATLTGGGQLGTAGAARKWVAWIAPPFVPYAPALQQSGVRVDALLLVHPSNKECLWTVEQVIRSGSSSGVLAWLAAADHVALRRLQLAAEEQGCWTILFRPFSARRTVLAPQPAAAATSTGRSPASTEKARSLEYGSTNAAAHGPASSTSPSRCAARSLAGMRAARRPDSGRVSCRDPRHLAISSPGKR